MLHVLFVMSNVVWRVWGTYYDISAKKDWAASFGCISIFLQFCNFGTILILSILKFRYHFFFFQTQIRVPWGFFFSLSNQKNTYKNTTSNPQGLGCLWSFDFWEKEGGMNPAQHSTACQELGTFHFPHYEDVNQMSLRFMKSGKILATSKGSSSGGKLGGFSYGFFVPWCCWMESICNGNLCLATVRVQSVQMTAPKVVWRDT